MRVLSKAKVSAAPARDVLSPAKDRASGDLYPALFVWGIWTTLVLGGVAFAVQYHTAIPFGEDWDHMIPWIAGDIPVTLRTLWEPIEVYRPFLLRLVMRVLLWFSGGYYSILSLFYLVCLGGLSFAMIRVSTRLRGWTSYADAFFPLVLLHWAFSFHVYFGETIGQLLPTMVAGTLLLVIVRRGTELTLGSGVVAGIGLTLLPLCSVYGMVYLPALLVWFVYAGVVAWRSGSPRQRKAAAVVLPLAAFALTLFGLYLVDLSPNSRGDSGASMWEKLRASWGMLTLSWGQAGVMYWPYSGFVTAALGVLSAGSLAVGVWHRPRANRPLGLLLFLGALATVFLAYGWGRATPGEENPVVFYYGSLPVLALCSLYFAWGTWHHRPAGSFVQMCLLSTAIAACSIDLQEEFGNEGFYWSSKRLWQEQKSFEEDVEKGMPPFQVLARHGNTVSGCSNSDAALLDQKMHELRRAGYEPFRRMEEDPVFQAVPLPLSVIDGRGATWDNGAGHTTDPEGYLTLSLGRRTFVAGLRIQVSYADDPNNSNVDVPKVAWKEKGADYPATPQYERRPSYRLPEPAGYTVYIAETIDEFRLYFTQGRDFRVEEIVLLTPKGEPPASP